MSEETNNPEDKEQLWCSACKEEHDIDKFSANASNTHREGKDYTCKYSKWFDHQARRLAKLSPGELSEERRKASDLVEMIDAINED